MAPTPKQPPAPVDSDADGVPDGDEWRLHTNPKLKDSDYDGLPDGTEVRLGTDPAQWDSDRDGRGDGTEIALRTDPEWREVRPRIDILEGPRQPTAEDRDGDGLPFHVEQRLGTDPWDSDTDDDGLGDWVEVIRGTDPANPYSNGAGDVTTDLDDVEAEIPGLRDAEAPQRVPPGIYTEFGHRIVFPGEAQSALESPATDRYEPAPPAALDTPDPFGQADTPDPLAGEPSEFLAEAGTAPADTDSFAADFT